MLKCRLDPYLFEAGLDPGNSDHKFLIQGLMVYNIINKRRLEIEDICKGVMGSMIDTDVFHQCTNNHTLTQQTPSTCPTPSNFEGEFDTK
jgi:hypothetical protein